MLKLDTPTWSALAKCQEVDPDELFVQGAEQNRVKVICQACPVRTECLADALDNQVEFGVWGGMTERERRAILKRRPNVRSWRQLLEDARADHARRDAPEACEGPEEQGGGAATEVDRVIDLDAGAVRPVLVDA